MENTENLTPWRKNLDKRYISGEDLLNGESMKKGLRKEMAVTLVKFNDAPAFDQKKQTEIDKTALWLAEYPSGKKLYKPCLLNVTRGEFLSKEIGGGSLFIDHFATDKPFVIYAKPDRRHGHVVAFKKYYAAPTIDDKKAIATLGDSTTMDELKSNWSLLSKEEQGLPSVLAIKESLKNEL